MLPRAGRSAWCSLRHGIAQQLRGVLPVAHDIWTLASPFVALAVYRFPRAAPRAHDRSGGNG